LLSIENIEPIGFLKGIGISTERVIFHKEEKTIYLYPEDWEKLRTLLGWPSVAAIGMYKGWTYRIVPEEIHTC